MADLSDFGISDGDVRNEFNDMFNEYLNAANRRSSGEVRAKAMVKVMAMIMAILQVEMTPKRLIQDCQLAPVALRPRLQQARSSRAQQIVSVQPVYATTYLMMQVRSLNARVEKVQLVFSFWGRFQRLSVVKAWL